MSRQWETIGELGLQFFGKISASISHEIKNTLAIMNENAGLLEDYCQLADKSKPVDPGRLKEVASSIRNQIRRTDGIVTNLNRFAHSTDQWMMGVDVGDFLRFMCQLTGRLAFIRGVRLKPEPLSASVKIQTNLFFLEHLFWLCLDFAISMAGEGRTIRLTADALQTGVRIILRGLEGLAGSPKTNFPGRHGKTLLRVLEGELEINEAAGELVLILPKEVSQ